MPEVTPSIRGPRRAILIWAVIATVAAFVFANASLFLWLNWRQTQAHLSEAEAHLAQATTQGPNPVGTQGRKARADSPFATLQDSEVAGRYHLFQEGTNVGIVTLLPDHSMINKDGTTLPQYHWEIQPDGLMTRWQAGRIFFDVMVKPGVYVLHGKGGREYRRLEKVEE